MELKPFKFLLDKQADTNQPRTREEVTELVTSQMNMLYDGHYSGDNSHQLDDIINIVCRQLNIND